MKSPHIASGQLGVPSQFNALRDDATGGGSLLAHQQLGAFSLGTNPSNNQTITHDINGTNVVATAVTSIGATAGTFLIGLTPAATLANYMNLMLNPNVTNSTQVAFSLANQQLLAYIGFALSGTNVTVYSFNTAQNAQLTSFSGSTTFTSGSYTAQTLKLYVEPGTYYINGTQVKFAGSSTPLVTAPSSHPRIDLLTIDNTGTLAWTTGSENVSPVPPTYPTYTKVPICELYNVVGETALYDFANQQAGQGYIQADVRSFPDVITDFTNISQDFIPDADNTRSLGSVSKQFLNIYAQNIFSGSFAVAFSKFGGSGADGALTISSGTTTINLGGASVFVKNYTSISITGTGALAFSNPHVNGTTIILKSQGNATITSSANPCIDIGSMGTAGGSAGLGVGSPTNATGPSASGGSSMVGQGNQSDASNSSGTAGGSANAAYGTLNWIAAATAPITVPNAGTPINGIPFALALTIRGKAINLCPSTGGSGSGGNNQSGSSQNGNVGGAGAGALYIECAGAWNFTGTINANGVAGGTNTSRSGNGGGGAGGVVLALYNLLTANTGTINTAGAGSPAGANGASLVAVNDEFA